MNAENFMVSPFAFDRGGQTLILPAFFVRFFMIASEEERSTICKLYRRGGDQFRELRPNI